MCGLLQWFWRDRSESLHESCVQKSFVLLDFRLDDTYQLILQVVWTACKMHGKYTATAYMLLTLYGGNTSGGDIAISLYSSKAVLPYVAMIQELLSLPLLGGHKVADEATDHSELSKITVVLAQSDFRPAPCDAQAQVRRCAISAALSPPMLCTIRSAFTQLATS